MEVGGLGVKALGSYIGVEVGSLCGCLIEVVVVVYMRFVGAFTPLIIFGKYSSPLLLSEAVLRDALSFAFRVT